MAHGCRATKARGKLAHQHDVGPQGRRLRLTSNQLRHTATRNVNEEMSDKRTTVQKVADWIAEFSGSIPFLLIHAVLFTAWIGVNYFPSLAFDPYPYGLLTMAVSLEAIFLSVFVLLSQNRQAAKDRVHADIEYDVNLKAELEIARLDRVQQLLPKNNDRGSAAAEVRALQKPDR